MYNCFCAVVIFTDHIAVVHLLNVLLNVEISNSILIDKIMWKNKERKNSLLWHN